MLHLGRQVDVKAHLSRMYGCRNGLSFLISQIPFLKDNTLCGYTNEPGEQKAVTEEHYGNAMMLLFARAKREREHIVRSVSHTRKVRAALGDGHLVHPPKVSKTDGSEKVVMGMCWIYFAEEVGRNLLQKYRLSIEIIGRVTSTYFASVDSVPPRSHDYVVIPKVLVLENHSDPLRSTYLPGFFSSFPSMYYDVRTDLGRAGLRLLFVRRGWEPRAQAILFVHCCAVHVGQHVRSVGCGWSYVKCPVRPLRKDADVALSGPLCA